MGRKLKKFDAQAMLEQKQLVIVAESPDGDIIELLDVQAVMISPEKGMFVISKTSDGETQVAPINLDGKITFFNDEDMSKPMIQIISKMLHANAFRVMVVDEEDEKPKKSKKSLNLTDLGDTLTEKLNVETESVVTFEINGKDIEKKMKETGKSKSQILADFVSEQLSQIIDEED